MKAKTPNEILKHHSKQVTQLPKNPLIKISGIKSKPKTVAPSRRVNNAKGGSA